MSTLPASVPDFNTNTQSDGLTDADAAMVSLIPTLTHIATMILYTLDLSDTLEVYIGGGEGIPGQPGRGLLRLGCRLSPRARQRDCLPGVWLPGVEPPRPDQGYCLLLHTGL